MTKKIDLSILIVNFNSTEYLISCVDSIKKSSISFPYEILVLDNASTDKKFSHFKQKYTDIETIESKINLGFGKANNILVAKSKGEFILFLNPDTLLKEDTLKIVLNSLKAYKGASVATCTVNLPNGQIDDACHRGFPTPWNGFCHFTGLSSLFPYSRTFNGYHLGYRNLDKIHEIDACAGAFMMVKRNDGDAVGWYDEDYFWYGEDLDLCFRIKKLGKKVIFIPSTSIVHYKGVTSGIKKHSENISKATYDTKIKATNSRFDVMKVFYGKHYAKKYPKVLKSVVLFGIEVKRKIALSKIKKGNEQ